MDWVWDVTFKCQLQRLSARSLLSTRLPPAGQSLNPSSRCKALLGLEETLKHSGVPEGLGTTMSSFSVLYELLP